MHQSLEVIFKTVEACNCNCSYCYYFGNNDRYFKHKDKKIVSEDTIKEIAHFLKQGVKSLDLGLIRIIFHGGEPLLQKKSDFDKMCDIFTKELSSCTEIQLGVQTNGTLITKGWCDLFNKYKIGPSISIDGPKKCHNAYRVNHIGKGTYDDVVNGIKLVQKHTKKHTFCPGTLTVINPEFSAKEIYRHFSDDLQLTFMDFLLPHLNHNTFPLYQQRTKLTIDDYGNYICDLFDEWVKDNNPEIDIRILKIIMRLLAGVKYTYLADFGPAPLIDMLPIITINHDGSLSPDDSYITTREGILSTGFTVNNTTLNDFIKLPIFEEIKNIRKIIPDECLPCQWVKICNGGFSITRYSAENGFNNPSIYCSAFKKIYMHIATYMITHGLALSKLYNILFE